MCYCKRTILEKCLQTGFVTESMLSFADHEIAGKLITAKSSAKEMSQYLKSLLARYWTLVNDVFL